MDPFGLVLVGVCAISAGIGQIVLRKYAFIRLGRNDRTVVTSNVALGTFFILAGVGMLIAAIAIAG